MAQSGLFIYTLDIMTHYPKIECVLDGNLQECFPEQICLNEEINPNIPYEIIWDSQRSMYNWLYDFDMLCA